MNDDFLKSRLQRVASRYRWVAVWRSLAVVWAIAALVAVVLVWTQGATGGTSTLTLPILMAAAAAAATTLMIVQLNKPADLRWIAQKIEKKHPELNGVLLTAVQQQQAAPGQEQGYLQYRVLQEATSRSQQADWRGVVPTSRLLLGVGIQVFALGCFVYALSHLRVTKIHGAAPSWVGADGVAVTPGDTSVEKGDSFVVLARFGGALPPNVSMVVRESGSAPRAVPLVKSLGDPVFGGSIAEVGKEFTYHLEYRGEKTRDFKVTVFEHPKLVRSDVDLAFPGYTKLAPKHIEDTRRVSAVEGTKIDLALQLNKPVKSAMLVARDGKKTEIPLSVSPDNAVATLRDFSPAKSLTYDLQLVDAEGRKNKIQSPFVIDVLPNRPPEIRLASPRGDVRPSALEEVAFEGTVLDDFGTGAYGLAYAIGGGEPKFIELGQNGAAKEKKTFAHLLKLEELGAKPDDLISWFVWADDTGPDGKVRRTQGDLYFGEVRPFDEIFRESQNMESGDDEGGGGGGGAEARKLTELQKQIISATWRLQRDGKSASYEADAKIVRESQEQALEQANEAAEEARSPRQQAIWKTVAAGMEKAIEKLKDAAKDPAPLAQALPAEQEAYQALLKLQARETNVTRNKKKGGGGGGKQGNQRQIDQLDLKQADKRYETQRQAKAPQSQERREQQAVMNRLAELARRQQDINERLKELQTALQEAQTEQQKEDIKRRLKRLEEEQRQMLADADEVKQRMDRAENQSSMSQQRQELDQTREDLQKAAEAAAEGSVAQALASGTRAQRQIQQMRDDLRKQNSNQFAEDLREMRNEARELSREQDEMAQKLETLANGGDKNRRKSLGDTDERKELGDKLTEQKERMNKLVEKATQVSEQAENTEPLLSRQLYDSVRKVAGDDANIVKQTRNELLNSGRMTRDLYDRLQKTAEGDQGGKALDLTRELLKDGYLPQARQAAQGARNEINDLRRGIERAADNVLGDDAEQLKLAQSELDSLTDQLRREISQSGGGQRPGNEQAGADKNGKQPGQRRGEGDQRQAGKQGENDPSQPGQGEQPGEGQGQGEGQGKQPGQRGERSQQKMAGNQPGGNQPGQQPGQGEQPGQQPGQGQQGGQGQGQGQQPGQQTAQAEGQQGQSGQGGQGGGGDQAGGNREGQRQLADNRGRRQLGDPRDPQDPRNGNNRGGIDNAFNSGGDFGGGLGGWEGGRVNVGPLTGEDFARWAERLRDVEDLVETPEMRNALAAARERARTLRRDFRQDQKKPDWTVVQMEIVKPLVEVRNRVAEELARRDSKQTLTPIDRDPVPNRFAEPVRRYYEELGKEK